MIGKRYNARLTECQKILFQSFEEDRREALHDRILFRDDELGNLGVSFPQGGGKTNRDTYIIESLFKKEEVDIRRIRGR